MKKLRKTFGYYIRKKERDKIIEEILDKMESVKKDFFKGHKEVDNFIECVKNEIKSDYVKRSYGI